ncbi:MAG: DNA polymerase III subunit gamma/tau, partial [Betaproteobacteria bacterium]
MSLALARKYRPRSFADVVGQEHVVRALSNALDTGRLHHAYLFTGTRGVGKTTLARIVAKCLNCETGVTWTPCGVCGACREIDTGRFIDLLELDAASNTQVDNMRELLENALYAPTAGRFKVYIIDEVHMLSRNAFNAMLKTLEEPPAHVKFILATTDAHRVPVTVLSRCLQFSLKQMPPAVVRERLEALLAQEAVGFDGAATALLARAASGSLRDGLSLLDQAIAHGGGRVDESAVRGMLGAVDATWLFDLLERLVAADGPGLMDLAGGLESRGLSFETALADLAALLQRLAVAQAVPSAIADDEPERARLLSLAGRLSPEDVQLHYQIALRGRADLPLAPDEFGGFTMTLLRMLAFAPVPPEGDGRRGAVPARGGSGASHGPATAAPASAPQAAAAPSAPPPAELSGG